MWSIRLTILHETPKLRIIIFLNKVIDMEGRGAGMVGGGGGVFIYFIRLKVTRKTRKIHRSWFAGEHMTHRTN